jgi:DNA-directed RNA polymerase subunit RPC12/RpoP
MPQGGQADIKCPYCGTTVIVPPELRSVDSARTQTVNRDE